MSLFFIVLNIVQISLIYTLSNYYWTALFPGVVFIVFVAILAYEWRRCRMGTLWRQYGCTLPT
jgi:hypothetical protein